MYWLFINVFITEIHVSILSVCIIIHNNNNMISMCGSANGNETIRSAGFIEINGIDLCPTKINKNLKNISIVTFDHESP